MRSSRAVLVLAVLLVLALQGCGARPGALPASSPAVTDSVAAPSTGTVDSLPAATHPSPGPTDAGLRTAASPAASAVDTTAPVVDLAVDPAVVPWHEQATVRVTARDDTGVVGLEVLLGDQVLATASDGELSFDLIPGGLDGVAPSVPYTLTARAADAAGNVGLATVAVKFSPDMETPTPAAALSVTATATVTATTFLPNVAAEGTPGPPPTPTPIGSGSTTSYRVTEITLLTYPYAAFLRETTAPNLDDYPVTVIDRAGYEASNPQPVPAKHRLIVLENRYLRLGILPDLGGRIYEATFKPTGHNEFYSNAVVKPTHWGPASPPNPDGANWWLGVGGLEWAFPVEEHGYESGKPWGFDHVTLPNGGVMLTLFTRYGPQLPYAVVDIILPPDAAYFVVQPRVTNPWGAPFKFKWWDTAMFAPGAANSPGPDLRFVFPTSEVTIHSTGDPALPGLGQPMSWPVYEGRDLSRLGNWTQYLGAFQRPAATGNFVGVYDTTADEGMLRIYPSDVARGVKLFSPGWGDPLDPDLWTDDGSAYVELHGGLTPTFDDWYELPPGGEVTWSEIWYPVAGIGGVTYANEDGALALTPSTGHLIVGLAPTADVSGQLSIALPGMDPIVAKVALDPAHPFVQGIALSESVPAEGLIKVTLTDAGGDVAFVYEGQARLRE